jgi:SNF2 family DNA or RNA helicase
MIAGRMKASEKTGILNAFSEAMDDKGKRKAKKDIRYLIGTTRLLGVGLQLTRACNLVLMEPDNEFVREMQGYARIHRIGQKNPLSRPFRLINVESEIEQQILKRQEDRREFPGRLIIESEIKQPQVVQELNNWEE